MEPLDGRRALVCGSTRGIGRACAMEFVRLGARVTLVARDEAALRAVRDELPAAAGASMKGGPAHDWVVADLDRPEAARAAVEEHLRRTGPIEILLNNNGGPPAGPIVDAPPAAFQSAFDSHLVCNQLLAQALVPGMKSAGYGRIINIVSTSVREPIKGLGVSNTIRAAVAGWAKTLAGELGPYGITVNNVLPGSTSTDRIASLIRSRARAAGRTEEEIEAQMRAEIPLGRFARPEEIAFAAGCLAQPGASYITGVSLAVDGGRTSCL